MKKKLLCLLLLISMFLQLAPLPTFAVSENDVQQNSTSLVAIRGDVDGNGLIDEDDLEILSKHVAKISRIIDADLLLNADVNSDSRVNAEDLTELSSFLESKSDFRVSNISVDNSTAVVGSVFEWIVQTEGGYGNIEYYFELNKVSDISNYSSEESYSKKEVVVSSEAYDQANYFCVNIVEAGNYSINVYCRDEEGAICIAEDVIPVTVLSQELQLLEVECSVVDKVCESNSIVWTVKSVGGNSSIIYNYTLLHDGKEIHTCSSDISSYTLDSCDIGVYQLKIECVDTEKNVHKSILSDKITSYPVYAYNLATPDIQVLNKGVFLSDTETLAGEFDIQSLLLEWDTVSGADEYGIEFSYLNAGEWITSFSVEGLTSCKYTLPQYLFRANINGKMFRIGVYSKGIVTGDIRYYYFCMSPAKVDSSINVNNGLVSVWDIAASNKVSRHFYVDSVLDYSVSADVDWITFVKGIDGFSATVAENSEHINSRSGVITVNNGENTMTIQVNQGDGRGAPVLTFPYLSSDENYPTSLPVGGITLEFEEYYAKYVGIRIYEVSGGENCLVYEKIVPRKTDFLHIPKGDNGYTFKSNTIYMVELSGHYSTSCNENEVEHDVEKNKFYVYMENDGHNILVEGSSDYEHSGYGDVTVNLHSTNTWTYSTDVDWIHVEDYALVAYYKDIEKIDIKVDPNYTENTRTGIVTFHCGEETATVKIIQYSWLPRFIYPNMSKDMSNPTTLPSSGLVLGTVYENATYATYNNGSWSDENEWGWSSSIYETYTIIPDNTYETGVLYRFTLKSGEYTTVYYAKFKANSTQNYIVLRDNTLGDGNRLEIKASSGKTEHQIKLKANSSWTIQSDVSWLSSSAMSGSKSTSWKTLTITAQSNNTGKARTGVLSFKIGSTVYATLTVTQPANDYIELFKRDDISGYIHVDPETSFKLCNGSGESLYLYAWANSVWGAESHSSWITIKGSSSVDNVKSGKYIDIELDKNTTNSVRTGTITVFCGNKSQLITITQVPGMETPTLVSPNISTDYKNPSSVKYGDVTIVWNAVKGAKYYKIDVMPSDRDLLLPDSSFYSFITEIKDTGKSTYSCVIPKTAFSLNMDTYDYINISAYDEYGYSVEESFFLISSLDDAARINGSTSPVWNNATDVEVSKEFIVTSTGSWSASSKSEWISIDKSSGSNGDILTVSLAKNTGLARSGKVVITVGNTETVLTVNQCAYLPEFPSIISPEFSDGMGDPTVVSAGTNSIRVEWNSAPQVEYYQVELLSYKTHGSKHVEASSPLFRKGENQYEFTGLNLQPGQVYFLSISQKSHWGYTGHNYYFTPEDETAWVLVEKESIIDYELESDEDCVRVDIESSGVWTASTNNDWIMIDSGHITKDQLDKSGVTSFYYSEYSGHSGEDMYISVLANPDNTYRYGTITVKSGGAEAVIEISQAPYYEVAEIYSPILAEKRVDSVGLPYGDIAFRWSECVGGSGSYSIILEEREEGSTYRYYDILEKTGITKTSYTIPASELKEGGYYCIKLCSNITGVDEDDSPCQYYYFYVKYKNELTVSADVNWNVTSANKMVIISASATGGAGGYQFAYELLCDGEQIDTTSLDEWKYYTFPLTEAGKYQVRVYCRDAAGGSSSYICNEYSLSNSSLDFIESSLNEWKVDASGGTTTLLITSSDPWIVSSFPDWILCSSISGNSGDSINLTASINPNVNRSGILVLSSGSSEYFINIYQAGSTIVKPTISYPVQDSTVDFSDISVSWVYIDNADSYIISLRDITTDNLLMYHERTTSNTYNIPTSYFINGHQYRVAVGANVYGQTYWSESVFNVIATLSSEYTDLNGYVFSSAGNPIKDACVNIYIQEDMTLVATEITDLYGNWYSSGLQVGNSYLIEVVCNNYVFDNQFTPVVPTTLNIDPILIVSSNSLDDETASIIDIELVESGLSFSAEADSKELYINAVDDWYAECDVDWITLSSYSGTGSQAIKVSVDENTIFLENSDYRSAKITIYEDNPLIRAVHKSESIDVYQDEPIKKIHVAYGSGEVVTTNNIFDERTGKYNGMELLPYTEYSFRSEKKIIIDQPMFIPEGTTVSIDGELIIKSEVVFSASIERTEGSGYYKRKYTVHSKLECDGLKVKSKGILNMNDGGVIYVDGNFDFDSSHDHSLYLKDGTIEVTGDVSLKDKFYPSGENTVKLSGNRVHNVYVKNQVFETDMYFNNLEVDNILFLKTKNVFDCKGEKKIDVKEWFIPVGSVDYLTIDFMGNRLSRADSDRIIQNINFALFDAMVRDSNLFEKQDIEGIYDLMSSGKEFKYYYMDNNHEFTSFTLKSTYSVGIGDTLAAAWMIYHEDSGPRINVIIGSEPSAINEMVEKGYNAIVRHAAESLVGGYVDLIKGMFNIELVTYIADKYPSLYDKLETPIDFMKNWVKINKEPVVKDFLKFLESIEQ